MSSLLTPILVSGRDAKTFLQGQLSCDVDKLTLAGEVLASVNSAQGRVQAVLTVTERIEGVVLFVTASMAERTIQRLKKYVLRAKVVIENAAARFDTLQPARYAACSNSEEALLTDLRAGIPHVFPETYESFVAQMLNLDVLNGISFEKGCYTGQEIIARAHFRGAVKRRMFRFSATCSPPIPGTRLLSNNDHAGDVVYAATTEQGCELLAVINLTQAEATLTCNDSTEPLARLSLPYSLAERDSEAPQ